MSSPGRSAVPLRLLAGFLLALVACSGGDDPNPAATASPSPSEPDPSPVATGPDEGSLAGPAIEDVAGHVPGGAGFAWHTPVGVVLTNPAGTAMGHLPGWTLDRRASDRLAAPVVVSPAGELRIVTSQAIVPLSEPWAVAGGTVVVDDGGWTLTGDDGDVRATGELTRADDLWVSATGTVVGTLTGEAYDLEDDVPLEVPAGCRLADRHTPEDPLHVCDDGARLTGGTDVPAPDGGRWGWVTVGPTGDEFLGTVHGADVNRVYLGSRAERRSDPVVEDGAALFFRSSGAAWVARLGQDPALLTLDREGTLQVLREVPGATDVMIWIR